MKAGIHLNRRKHNASSDLGVMGKPKATAKTLSLFCYAQKLRKEVSKKDTRPIKELKASKALRKVANGEPR